MGKKLKKMTKEEREAEELKRKKLIEAGFKMHTKRAIPSLISVPCFKFSYNVADEKRRITSAYIHIYGISKVDSGVLFFKSKEGQWCFYFTGIEGRGVYSISTTKSGGCTVGNRTIIEELISMKYKDSTFYKLDFIKEFGCWVMTKEEVIV